LKVPGLPPRPRALLFDWDNTLVDTWAVIHQSLVPAFEAMGHEPWTLAQVRERVRASARDAFPQLFGERAEEAASIFYRHFEAIHLERLAPLPGAAALLRKLSAAGLDLGVVSNKRGITLRKEAAHLGWDRLFRRLVGATDAARDKPAADPVHLALEGGPVGAGGEVWFVGDTDIDMRCAVAAGCHPVLLREEPPQPGEFHDCLPVMHLRNCEALAELLVG